jgi:hypothetical protein
VCWQSCCTGPEGLGPALPCPRLQGMPSPAPSQCGAQVVAIRPGGACAKDAGTKMWGVGMEIYGDAPKRATLACPADLLGCPMHCRSREGKNAQHQLPNPPRTLISRNASRKQRSQGAPGLAWPGLRSCMTTSPLALHPHPHTLIHTHGHPFALPAAGMPQPPAGPA